MMEPKHAELERRIVKKHTKIEKQTLEGKNHELKESSRRHKTEVLKQIEDIAAAKEKKCAAAARAQNEPQQKDQKVE